MNDERKLSTRWTHGELSVSKLIIWESRNLCTTFNLFYYHNLFYIYHFVHISTYFNFCCFYFILFNAEIVFKSPSPSSRCMHMFIWTISFFFYFERWSGIDSHTFLFVYFVFNMITFCVGQESLNKKICSSFRWDTMHS